MKTLFFVAFFMVALYNTATAQKNTNEREAIRKVIDQETRAYFEQKYDLWASTWVQDSTAFRLTVSPSSFSKITGWDKLNAGVKESMQTATPYSEEDMAPYTNKFDYEYYINGNMATVFLKEGKTLKDANDEIRLMVKQNGAWKLLGLTIISTPNYNFNNSVEKLRTFIGKWKMVEGSLKSEPADTAYHAISLSTDFHEVMNGMESSSSAISEYSGNINVYTETEQFIPDYEINKFRYYDNGRSANGYIVGGAGTAEFDSTGSFVVTMMYDDKPVVKLKNIYTMKKDGSLHIQADFFNKEGKKTFSWSSDLTRL